MELENLKEFIGAADMYITPYFNEAQITSGTLAYAFGAGKAVVSTPYWHAAELLAEDRGVLVPFGDRRRIAREVIGLLRDDNRRHAMRKNAYKIGREMIWSNVAQTYMRSFERRGWKGRAAAQVSRHQDARPDSRANCREMKLEPSFADDRFHRRLPARHLHRSRIFPKAIAPTTTPARSSWRCCSSELGEDPESVRRVATTSAAFLQHAFDLQTETIPQPPEFRPALAG